MCAVAGMFPAAGMPGGASTPAMRALLARRCSLVADVFYGRPMLVVGSGPAGTFVTAMGGVASAKGSTAGFSVPGGAGLVFFHPGSPA